LTVGGDAALFLLSSSLDIDLHDININVRFSTKMYTDVSSIITELFSTSVLGDTAQSIVIVGNFTTERELSLVVPGVDDPSPDTGDMCIYVTGSLEASSIEVYFQDHIALPGKIGGIEVKGAFTCGKVVTPERSPRYILFCHFRLAHIVERTIDGFTIIISVSVNFCVMSSLGSSSFSRDSSASNHAPRANSGVAAMVITLLLLIGLIESRFF
jgi:hypothetical protein